MTQKILKFTLFFIFVNFVFSDPPKCITTLNAYYGYEGVKFEKNVDWWFMQSGNQNNGAFYTDSNLSEKEMVIELPGYNIRTLKTPFSLTYDQVKDPNFKSMVYNDQLAKDKKGKEVSSNEDEGAHSKGFFIWNEDGGIHVIHSNPKVPYSNQELFKNLDNKDLENQEAQHFFCVAISKDDLNLIPMYSIFTSIRISNINGFENYFSTLYNLHKTRVFPSEITKKKVYNGGYYLKNPLKGKNSKFSGVKDVIDTQISTIDFFKDGIYIVKWSELSYKVFDSYITSDEDGTNVHYDKISSNKIGSYFIQTPVNIDSSMGRKKKDDFLSKFKYNIIYEFIANHPDYKEYNWICHTQSKIGFTQNFDGTSTDMMAYKRHKIDHVQQFATPWNDPSNRKNIQVSSGRDHSKLFYGFKGTDLESGVICFSDLNWQLPQEKRGGGMFCSNKMSYLANYFRRHVSILKMPVKRFESDFGLQAQTNPQGNEVLVEKYLYLLPKPNSVAEVPFDFSEIKKYLSSKLKDNSKLFDFEIKVFDSNSNAIPVPGKRVIIINQNLKQATYLDDKVTFKDYDSSIKYNNGYEKVYIPLMVVNSDYESFKFNQNQRDINTIDFSIEEFSFNIFTSNRKHFILCTNYKNCDYEDSESIELLKYKTSGKLTVTTSPKKEKGKIVGVPYEYVWTLNQYKIIDEDEVAMGSSIKIKKTTKDLLLEKLKFVNYLSNLKQKIFGQTLPNNIKLIQKDNIKYTDFPLNKDNNKCFSEKSIDGSIGIYYQKNCIDQLIYCLDQIVDNTKVIEKKRHFIKYISELIKGKFELEPDERCVRKSSERDNKEERIAKKNKI